MTLKNKDLKDYKEFLLYNKLLEPTSVNRKLVAIHQFLIFNEIVARTKKVKVQEQQFINLINKKDIDKLIRTAMIKKDIRSTSININWIFNGCKDFRNIAN